MDGGEEESLLQLIDSVENEEIRWHLFPDESIDEPPSEYDDEIRDVDSHSEQSGDDDKEFTAMTGLEYTGTMNTI